MAFLRAGDHAESLPVIQGGGVAMRPPAIGDYKSWAELRALSRGHLTCWEPTWLRDELTKSGFRRRLSHYEQEARDETGFAFLIFSTEDAALLGGLTLSNVRRGVSQSVMLGYWIGLPFTARGHMTSAVKAIQPYVFDVLKLHRIEAAVQPENTASILVLERNGFEHEGLLKRYLKIDGRWQDHMLYALTIEDWVKARQENA